MKTITAPASKSVSHRAVLCASLAQGSSILSNVLRSDDLQRTLECVRTLGAKIEFSNGQIKVQGPVLDFPYDFFDRGLLLDLDVGESGTTCRLITPLAALSQIPCLVHGQGRMHQRPISELTTALKAIGAQLTWLGKKGFPPFLISSRGLNGGKIRISLEQSSQYLSGVLLAAPFLTSPSEIQVTGNKAVSWPYVALTIQAMQDFGVPVQVQCLTDSGWQEQDFTTIKKIQPGQICFLVNPARYQPRELQVEADWSNASYFLGAGLLLPAGIRVLGLRPDSLQGDRKIVDILQDMGGTLHWQGSGLEVRPGDLSGIEVDMGECPDLVPTVAVLASLATSPTHIFNVAHLRIKESDRLQALATEIGKTGAQVEVTADGLKIRPVSDLPRGKIHFTTYGDHRIAMSLSLYQLKGLDLGLDSYTCVNKSFPDFWDKWKEITE